VDENRCRRFEGKVVIVTGAARGIGLGIAKAFASEGASIALNDVNVDHLKDALSEILTRSPGSRAYAADVTKKDQVRAIVENVVKDFGRIDVLVNNAGIGLPTKFLDLSEEEYDRVMGVNLKGAIFVTQAVLPHMVQQKYGKIVMISSISGKMGGVATGVHYSISKGGLMVLARQLAREFGSLGINVNAVAPSFAETDMLKDLGLEGKKDEMAQLNVIKRLAKPDDIANAVLFLASDASSFITGETVNVSGGRLMD
jgi:3-oxoacyl-[acyl-carrier protein] reductase